MGGGKTLIIPRYCYLNSTIGVKLENKLIRSRAHTHYNEASVKITALLNFHYVLSF